MFFHPAQFSLSRLLYWIASARCSILISGLSERSAMVRLTLRMQSCALALKFSFCMAVLSHWVPASLIWHISFTWWAGICALLYTSFLPGKRSHFTNKVISKYPDLSTKWNTVKNYIVSWLQCIFLIYIYYKFIFEIMIQYNFNLTRQSHTYCTISHFCPNWIWNIKIYTA